MLYHFYHLNNFISMLIFHFFTNYINQSIGIVFTKVALRLHNNHIFLLIIILFNSKNNRPKQFMLIIFKKSYSLLLKSNLL